MMSVIILLYLYWYWAKGKNTHCNISSDLYGKLNHIPGHINSVIHWVKKRRTPGVLRLCPCHYITIVIELCRGHFYYQFLASGTCSVFYSIVILNSVCEKRVTYNYCGRIGIGISILTWHCWKSGSPAPGLTWHYLCSLLWLKCLPMRLASVLVVVAATWYARRVDAKKWLHSIVRRQAGGECLLSLSLCESTAGED